MTTKSRKLAVFGLASFAILLLFALGLYIPYLKAYGLIHPARTLPGRTPADAGMPDFQSVEFASSDGLKLRGWYIPPHNGAVVVFVHGHGANRAEFLSQALQSVTQ